MRGRAAGKARGSKLGSRDKRTCTQSAALSLTVTWPQFSHSVRWGHSSAYLVRSGQGSQGLLSAKSLPQGQGGGWRAQGSGDAVPAMLLGRGTRPLPPASLRIPSSPLLQGLTTPASPSFRAAATQNSQT